MDCNIKAIVIPFVFMVPAGYFAFWNSKTGPQPSHLFGFGSDTSTPCWTNLFHWQIDSILKRITGNNLLHKAKLTWPSSQHVIKTKDSLCTFFIQLAPDPISWHSPCLLDKQLLGRTVPKHRAIFLLLISLSLKLELIDYHWTVSIKLIMSIDKGNCSGRIVDDNAYPITVWAWFFICIKTSQC